ncbi:hypothetical protein ABB29_12000 [Pseudoxanthomonas dokdonensis]|uniref:Uncharacterized protein n=1 Tax=Pseudoxanthomonas dokdonensis TaxID=344882 RepID=A0A0R0CVU7_9GAMM|nr:hypothetical protein ABB29_12000 [Pseudoxanthomonas dokdonensis]
MISLANMTLAEQLREMQRFHDQRRQELDQQCAQGGAAALYHGHLSDAAARAAAAQERKDHGK